MRDQNHKGNTLQFRKSSGKRYLLYSRLKGASLVTSYWHIVSLPLICERLPNLDAVCQLTIVTLEALICQNHNVNGLQFHDSTERRHSLYSRLRTASLQIQTWISPHIQSTLSQLLDAHDFFTHLLSHWAYDLQSEAFKSKSLSLNFW